MSLVNRMEKLNKKSEALLIETGGLCIQMASGKEMGDINWTGLLKGYSDLLTESMKYNMEFTREFDNMNAKLDYLIDRLD